MFLLSLRLRQREIETMRKIGGTRLRVVGICVSEIILVLITGICLAALLTLATYLASHTLIRELVQ